MDITPYVMLDGQAKAAVHFYADVFDTTVLSLVMAKDWPEEFDGDLPKEMEDRVMHAHLKIGNSNLMLADTFPDDDHVIGSSITLMVGCSTLKEAQQIYNKLAEEGSVLVCCNETGFSPGYAQVRDKYGIEWQIITESA